MENLLALPNGIELVGDYRIKRVLGAGGFGITYLARETPLNRSVAIKEYFPSEFAARQGESLVRFKSQSHEQDYETGLERFIDEARTLARFDHPNIVRVFRYFRANNTGYMALQFEKGRSFKRWLDELRRPPDQGELDAILKPLLEALELIHRHDFLHRDIAPDNIIIRTDGSPVLIDFGSARGDIARQTKTVSAIVKPGYSPFEQYVAKGAQQGPWTDIYSLAATLYHAVTGRRPPDAPTRISSDEMISAGEAARGAFRAGFLSAIDRALAVQAEIRPRAINEWRKELFGAPRAPIVARPAPGRKPRAGAEPGGAEPPARPIEAPGRTRKIDQHRAPPLVWRPPRKRPKPPADPEPVPAASPQRDGTPPPPNPPSLAAPPAGMSGGALPVRDAGADRDRHLVTRPVPARAWRSPVNGHQARAMLAKGRRLVGRFARALPEVPAGLARLPRRAVRADAGDEIRERQAAPAPAPDPGSAAEKVAKVVVPDRGDAGAAKAREVAPGVKKPERAGKAARAGRRVTKAAGAERARPKPRRRDRRTDRADGRSLRKRVAGQFAGAVRVGGRIAVALTIASLIVYAPNWLAKPGSNAPTEAGASPSGLGLVRTLRGHVGFVRALATSPDGKTLVSAGADGSIIVWDLATGKAGRIFREKGIAKSIDVFGDRLVVALGRGGLAIHSLASGKLIRRYKGRAGGYRSAAFGGRRTRIFAAGDGGVVRLLDTRRGTRRSLKGHKGAVLAMAYSPGRRTLVTGGRDDTVKLWDTRRRRLIRTIHAHTADVLAVAITRNGKTVASGGDDKTIKLWNTKSPGKIRTLLGHGGAITALVFSPDGQLLASASEDNTVRLWQVTTGRLVHTYEGHSGAVRALAFRPDGRRLISAGEDRAVRIWNARFRQ